MSISNPVPTTAIVDANGWMLNNFRTWTQQLTRAFNDQIMLTGSGSPEGVVTASPTRLYMDTSGTAGSILYVKQTGTADTGWILV